MFSTILEAFRVLANLDETSNIIVLSILQRLPTPRKKIVLERTASVGRICFGEAIVVFTHGER